MEKSLTKEMLRTNKLGAYSVTTIIDCNTRKYDGLLVAPLPNLGPDNYVLLSSLDETVIQHGAEFNMGIHKFGYDYYSPKGHKYIREFNIETVAGTTYRVGGVIFSKERVLISDENRILIRYTLKDAQSPTIMRFRPLLAFRSVNELCHENNSINQEFAEIENGISSCLYSGFPNLNMQLSKKGQFVADPTWYKGVEYTKEQERGWEYKEDLYTPGYFEVPLKKGESVIFSAGISPCDATKLFEMYDNEISQRTSRLDFFNSLKNAGQQFHNSYEGCDLIMAGYPWFKCRARDQFIALPGISLSINETERFEKVMQTAIQSIRKFMAKEEYTCRITEIEAPDVLLWFIWAIQQYAIKTSIKQANEKYGDILFEVASFIRTQQHPNLSLHENGLLSTNGHDKPASWMNGTAWGKAVIQRSGYLVEINALWYNNLKFLAEIASEQQNEYEADVCNYQAEFAKQAFVKTFWNGTYLYDFVECNDRNQEVRPNMIFAVSLPYSPLDKTQQKLVLDTVTKELLTPKGLRSLSPKSGLYNPEYKGNEIERNYSYHNGTAWPWLMGAYAEAYLKIHPISGLSFIERKLIAFESEMSELCIGTLNELFDGNPPFKGHGAMSFAMNVAEILRTLELIRKSEEDFQKKSVLNSAN